MKKLFKITPIKDYGVVVTRKIPNGKINPNDYYLLNMDGIWELMKCQDQDEADRCNSNTVIGVNSAKIMYSIGKRLDGVPLIELPDAAEIIFKSLIDTKKINTADASKHEGFFIGYKANINKYSEEDMNKAYYRNETRFKGEPFEVFIQSLQQPIPTEVELGTEQLCHQTGRPCGFPCNGEDNCLKSLYIKITNPETNTITALNASYEK